MNDAWLHLARRTPARIALGRSGAGLPTGEVLRFGLAHALARDAVHASLDVDALARDLDRPCIRVESAAGSRAAYLRRPDWGRRLSDESRARLVAQPCDLAVMIGDGLSAYAVQAHAAPLMAALRLPAETPVALAAQARVALGDEIGAALGARAVLVLIGERPGLSAADSLGAYITFGPRAGLSDADRNCVSNIRAGGLGYGEAATRVRWLLAEAARRGASGIALKDESRRAQLPS
jgi:ethanolamine ammonia-lyase small subunit